MSILIRPENIENGTDPNETNVSHDRESIREIHEQAFGRPNEADLVDALRQSPDFLPALSLVAEYEGRLLGHVLFSPVTVEEEGTLQGSLLALAPVAVRPDSQRQGIGTRLIWTGLIYAASESAGRSRHDARGTRALQQPPAFPAAGFPGVVLVGHPNYYPRFGFQPASRYGLKPPFPLPDAVFMAFPFTYESLGGLKGTVIYPPAFRNV